jgi:hypothetical protein
VTNTIEGNNMNSNVISVTPSCYSSLLFSFEKITFDVLKNISSGSFFNNFYNVIIIIFIFIPYLAESFNPLFEPICFTISLYSFSPRMKIRLDIFLVFFLTK